MVRALKCLLSPTTELVVTGCLIKSTFHRTSQSDVHVTSHVTILCFIVVALFLFFEAGASPSWLSGKESTCLAVAAGDAGSISGWGRSLGGGHGNPLQYSCLEALLDRGAWWGYSP